MKLSKIWLILGAYGVFFAIFSGLEEAVNGKYWKIGLALIVGIITIYLIESSKKKQ